MSNDGIARWKQPIGAAAGFDAFESMVQEVLQLSAAAAAPSDRRRLAAGMQADLAAAGQAALRRRQGWTPLRLAGPQAAVPIAAIRQPAPSTGADRGNRRRGVQPPSCRIVRRAGAQAAIGPYLVGRIAAVVDWPRHVIRHWSLGCRCPVSTAGSRAP